jgi:hypothetical protein
MRITKIKIHGFEQPFVFNPNQSLREWRKMLKPVKAEGERLRILTKQNGMTEVKEEPLAHDFDDATFASHFLEICENTFTIRPDTSSDDEIGAFDFAYFE